MTTTPLQEITPAFIGVDVASKHLDCAIYGRNGVPRIKNTNTTIEAWLATLPPGTRIGLESTGRYHRTLTQAAFDRGMTVYLLNPRDVRHYARGMGVRGKTDRLDAQLLARYVEREYRDLRPWQPQPASQCELDELLRQRATLVKTEQALRMSAADSSAFRKMIEPLLETYRETLKTMDKQIAKAVAAVDAGSGDFACIRSVPGIGLLSGAALLGLFRRLATRGSDAVIAFLGLDPRPMDSGQRQGTRRLSKRGPSEWRRLLFNAAMSASRTEVWKAHYERERAKGLPSTAALNILARKLVKVAFGLFKTHTQFDPTRVVQPATAA